ncbi:hypothetical protein [Streptomyces boninensis]|uniref:hypothetical protein n=1 Tax=Streptomyces boninensis TaxID=2039455 RepID=UPI003B211DCA
MGWTGWFQGRRAVALASAVVLAAGATGVYALLDDGDDGRYHGCDDADATYDPAYQLPAESAQDWVSFGDHVAIYHVRKGSEKPTEEKETRTAELVVDKVLHSRPGAKKLPHSFRARLWEVPCEPWITTGHRYLGPLVFDSPLKGDPAAWWPMHGGGVLPYDGKAIGTGEIMGKSGETPPDERSPFGLSKQMHGEHALSLQSLLQQTEPYSEAARHPALPPGKRAELVSKSLERQGDS